MSTETEKKKIAIGAVIEFCRAKGYKNSKTEVFRFFGVIKQTGNQWFPGTGSSNDGRPRPPGNGNGPPTLQNPDQQPQPLKRQNPIRNGGRDRKRLKSMIEDMQGDFEDYGSPPPLSPPSPAKSSSSSLLGEPVTPPKRKIAKPIRKSGEQDGHQVEEESMVEIKSEIYDDEIGV